MIQIAPLIKVEGKAFSPAEECKRILELGAGGITGAKSVVKHEKRVQNRKVRNYHFWVLRGPDETTLSSLKYESPDKKFTKEKMMESCQCITSIHVWKCVCNGFVLGEDSLHNCVSCRLQMKQPWQNGIGLAMMLWRVPWTDQQTSQLMCDAVYCNSVPRELFWHARSSPP